MITTSKGKIRIYKFKTNRPIHVIAEYLETYPNKPVEYFKYRLVDKKIEFTYYSPSPTMYRKYGLGKVTAKISGVIDFDSNLIILGNIEEEDILELLLDILRYVLSSDIVEV